LPAANGNNRLELRIAGLPFLALPGRPSRLRRCRAPHIQEARIALLAVSPSFAREIGNHRRTPQWARQLRRSPHLRAAFSRASFSSVDVFAAE